MMTHTKGPWEYRDSKIVAVNVRPDWADVGGPYADERVTVVNLFGAMGGDDTKADAALIAASPDLLAALCRLMDLITATGPRCIADYKIPIANAKAAIAKATGGEA